MEEIAHNLNYVVVDDGIGGKKEFPPTSDGLELAAEEYANREPDLRQITLFVSEKKTGDEKHIVISETKGRLYISTS